MWFVHTTVNKTMLRKEHFFEMLLFLYDNADIIKFFSRFKMANDQITHRP